MSDNGVFISYRRGTGSAEARVIQAYLESKGFDVFLDVDRLGSGHFDEQLLRQIESRRNFVLVCSPGSLDRCANEGDWVRREIAHALKTKRHIVPVTLPGFAWPSGDGVPAEVAALQRHNAFEYSHNHWSMIRRKLALMLKSSAQRRPTGAAGSQESARPARNRGLWILLAVSTVMVTTAVGWMFMSGVIAIESSKESELDPSSLHAARAMGGTGPSPTTRSTAEKAQSSAVVSEPAEVGSSLAGQTPDSGAQTPESGFAGAEPDSNAEPQAGLNWEWDAEVVAAEPDPSVVTDADGRARMSATGLPWKVRDRTTGIVMLLCPPGEFIMGSPVDEKGRGDDEWSHKVTLEQAFYISETEVTQEQWELLMGSNPSPSDLSVLPVERVSWKDCQLFCERSGMRLPSEVEWEYACRAGTTGAYANDLGSIAWFGQNSHSMSHPVKSKLPNPWGLYDMHGNVAEWCEDAYAKFAAKTQVAAAVAEVDSRVLRGGSWSDPSEACRSASREGLFAGNNRYMAGFRVARTPG